MIESLDDKVMRWSVFYITLGLLLAVTGLVVMAIFNWVYLLLIGLAFIGLAFIVGTINVLIMMARNR